MVYHLVKVRVCRPRARFFHCLRQVQDLCLDRKGHHQGCLWQSELLLCPGLLPSRRGVTKMACGQILAASSSSSKDANLWPAMVEWGTCSLFLPLCKQGAVWGDREAVNPARAGTVGCIGEEKQDIVLASVPQQGWSSQAEGEVSRWVLYASKLIDWPPCSFPVLREPLQQCFCCFRSVLPIC